MDARLLKSLIEKKPNETTNNRLESLRLPRDLSLGGTKPKKIFQPNLNVSRAKHRAKESNKKLESTKKEKPKPQPKKKFTDNKRFVQSQGIFSEGSTHEKRPAGFSSRSKYDSDPSSSIAIPTYRKSDSTINNEREDDIFTSLVDMQFDDNDEKINVAEEWNYTSGHDVVEEVKMEGVHPYFSKMEEAELNSRLALIKMPQSLAGKVLSDNPNDTKLLHYHLNMMTEGKIGTLQITRSGKMYMKIGNMRYLMETIDCTGGSEIVATYINSSVEGTKAKFAILGDIDGRFQLVPQWTDL